MASPPDVSDASDSPAATAPAPPAPPAHTERPVPPGSTAAGDPSGAQLPRIVPRRHLGRLLAAAGALLVFAMVLRSVILNQAFQWGWWASTSPPRPCSTDCC